MTWKVSASLINCKCMWVGVLMYARPLPNPADTSHPKKKWNVRTGRFHQMENRNKMEMIINLHLQTETSSYQTPSEFSIHIKPWNSCLRISPSKASHENLPIRQPPVVNIIGDLHGAEIYTSWNILFQIFNKACDGNAI